MKTKLPPLEEKKFRKWYTYWSSLAGIDPDPDNPLHQYDYRAAYRAGVVPSVHPSDGLYHWPSEYKSGSHPNRFVGEGGSLLDTLKGSPATLGDITNHPGVRGEAAKRLLELLGVSPDTVYDTVRRSDPKRK